jgi:hypothetical protein
MKRLLSTIGALGCLGVLLAGVATAAGLHPPSRTARLTGEATAREFAAGTSRDYGNFVSECPQAKYSGDQKPLQQIDRDQVWQLSERGDDLRFNYDLACVPQNETTIAINPRDHANMVGGANDYQGDYNQFDATSSKGKGVYGSLNIQPSTPFGYTLIQSDPVLIYDRDGVAYNQEIAFYGGDDSNGVFVWRSTNGGFTWSRPCVTIENEGTPDPDDGVCGGPGNPVQPGDGTITWNQDPSPFEFNGDAPFDDKNWLAAGPRPAGVSPTCFKPVTHSPTTCNRKVIGSDRLHATWTRFDLDGTGNIYHSYSDDQARSWSPPKAISGSAAFCSGIATATSCDDNQFSVPTVHPKSGLLGVAFENSNVAVGGRSTPNQYLFVRSADGGATFHGPFHVTPVFDRNYPTGATRPDCQARGQSAGRDVLTNSCFRVNSAGNVAIDKRGGSFGDDFYLVLSDNRNGTAASSNTDVFFFRSTNGGSSWVGPTRINDDPSVAPPDRGCSPANASCGGNFGNDQWFPCIDVNADGVLAVAFYDRRLDTDSMAHAWPASRQRRGNYLSWRFGAGCEIDHSPSHECLASGASAIAQPSAPATPVTGPVPGQGASYLGPFANQVLSDVPSNYDYSFRAGLFMGDYDQVSFPNFPHVGGDADKAVAIWTDARNGRGSGAPTSFQAGRNPACEQADMFIDFFDPLKEDESDSVSDSEQKAFLVTPCPGD